MSLFWAKNFYIPYSWQRNSQASKPQLRLPDLNTVGQDKSGAFFKDNDVSVGKLKKAPAEQPQMMRPFITSLVSSVRELLLHYFLFKLCLVKSIGDVHSSNISCFHSNLSFEVSSCMYRKTYASQYWKSVRNL